GGVVIRVIERLHLVQRISGERSLRRVQTTVWLIRKQRLEEQLIRLRLGTRGLHSTVTREIGLDAGKFGGGERWIAQNISEQADKLRSEFREDYSADRRVFGPWVHVQRSTHIGRLASHFRRGTGGRTLFDQLAGYFGDPNLACRLVHG